MQRAMEENNAPIFDVLVWGGAALTVAGLILLMWCVWRVISAKRSGASDEDMRAILAKVLPMNLSALALSALGLMLVIIGLFLG